MSRRIKLILSYDGTDFSGWQLQKNDRTVQEEIEKALEKLHGKPVRITGSGRTDAGVHAVGQVCHFDTDSSIPDGKFKAALNSLLPHDVRILSSCEAADDFHARYSARRRVYMYYIRETEFPLPFYRNYCYRMRNVPPLNSLNACARQIVGVHDFTTFSAAGDRSSSKIREIYASNFFIENGYIVYKIEGTAFLWKMVRSLVGTMLEVASSPLSGGLMKEILLSKERNLAGPTAPAQGLYFFKVEYE